MRTRYLALALTMTAAFGSAATAEAAAAPAATTPTVTTPAVTTPAPAAAPAPASGANFTLSYDAPQISADGTHVNWHWTLHNDSRQNGSDVVLVSDLTPALVNVTATAPCTVTTNSEIRCVYSLVKAGASEQGTISADLPTGLTGSINIAGRLSWQWVSSTGRR